MQKPLSAAICILNLTSCARGDTIYLHPLQVNNIFVFIPQVASVPTCCLFKTSVINKLTFDLKSGVPGPLSSRVRSDVCDRHTYIRQKHRLMPPPYGGGITTAQNVPQADQPRAFDDDDLFSFMARNDVPQEQDLQLLNLIIIISNY